MTKTLCLILCSAACLFCAAAAGMAEEPPSGEFVNPHWTGRHCRECHLEEEPNVWRAELRFGGDAVLLCNRCHSTQYSKTDIHPVNVAPLENMQPNIPENFPLRNGKIDCFTCHDVKMQMKENMGLKSVNPDFLRNGPYRPLSVFCFRCHVAKEYKKKNPHKQLDAQGRIIKSRCLFCHQLLPGAAQEDISEVSFKSELALYCVNCHGRYKNAHPASGDHLIRLSEDQQARLTEYAREQGVKLPLDGDRVFCGTCHNPHDKGVLKTEAARRGAGEPDFLRLTGQYDLCIACHADKQRPEGKGPIRTAKAQFDRQQDISSIHKSWWEDKCKQCHAISAENRKTPKSITFCFRPGCHKPAMLEKKYRHESSVFVNCKLCHRPHASANEKLLWYPEITVCRACHPLLRDTGEKTAPGPAPDNETLAADRALKTKQHGLYMDYISGDPALQEQGCSFCHDVKHKANINVMELKTCSGCHMFVQKVMSQAAAKGVNRHQQFKEKKCSKCHDAHSAEHDHILKSEKAMNPELQEAP